MTGRRYHLYHNKSTGGVKWLVILRDDDKYRFCPLDNIARGICNVDELYINDLYSGNYESMLKAISTDPVCRLLVTSLTAEQLISTMKTMAILLQDV